MGSLKWCFTRDVNNHFLHGSIHFHLHGRLVACNEHSFVCNSSLVLYYV